MTDVRPTIVPAVDVPLKIAVEELTGFEVLGIEKRYKRNFDELSGPMIAMGAVWSFGNRDGGSLSWVVVEAMTLREINGYFAAEPDDLDESDPESELGKESPSDERPT